MAIKGIENFKNTIESFVSCNDSKEEISCPICDKKNWENIENYVRKSTSYMKPVICKTCGYITYNPQCKNLSDFYKIDVTPQSKSFLITKFNKLDKHEKIIYKYLDEHNIVPKNAFDYGCSDGYLLKDIKKRYGSNVQGIEINRGHANWAKYVEDLDVTTCDDLSLYDDKDLVIIYHVIEHVTNPDKLLKNIRKIMSEDGLLYLATPRLDIIEYNTREEIYKEDHLNLFTIKSIINLLNKCGFEMVCFDNDQYGYAVICKKSEEKKFISCYEETIELLSKIDNSLLALEKSRDMLGRGMILETKKMLKEAIDKFSNFPSMVVYYASMFDVIDEIDIISEFIEENPQIFPLTKHLISLYVKDSDFETAIKLIDEVESIEGESILTLHNRAQIYAYQGKLKDAVAVLKRAYDKNPYDDGIIMTLAQFTAKM